MKQLKSLIIGIIILLVNLVSSPSANAEYCNPNSMKTHYKKIYCGMKLYDNDEADKAVIKAVAAQFEFDKKIVEGILSNTICETIKDNYDEKGIKKLPEVVTKACSDQTLGSNERLASWTLFVEVQNAYNKEKSLQHNARSLKFKFKVAEQYWDGTLNDSAPFDLIVDLNLIDIVLFGSKAQWNSDVFAFPLKEDEEDMADPDFTFDELLETDSSADGDEDEDSDGSGLSFEDTEDGGLPPGCVEPGDPDAEPDYGPADVSENLLCGDGNIDPLFGEQCDDGNTEAGDGCSQFCQFELTGSSEVCEDPEAVTFQDPGSSGSDSGGDGSGDDDSGGNGCPPGSVPTAIPTLTGEGAPGPQDVPQSLSYPGPFVGGTLKQFPPSARPSCPNGFQAYNDGGGALTAQGNETVGINIAGTQYDIPRCLPTEFCADFDAARDFLFGEDWEKNETDLKIATAIELMFCVDIIKDNRPESPYAVIEGCVDCHIAAMVDAVEEALDTNVSPLQNTTSAFGISNRFGPNFSFNLITAMKGKVKYKYSPTIHEAIKKKNEANLKARKEAETNKPATHINTGENAVQKLKRNTDEVNESHQKLLESTRLYSLSTDSIAENEVNGRVKPLLNQMKASFESMQSKYEAIIGSTYFDEKKQCTLN